MFVKYVCNNCAGHIEFDGEQLTEENWVVLCPHCGSETRLFIPVVSAPSSKSVTSVRGPEIRIPPGPDALPAKERKRRASQFSKLTQETIRERTKSGDTALHKAAKNGQFNEIPSHLLSVQLFMAQNNDGQTALHVAAKHGHLDQIPREFLTRETLTISTEYSTPKSVARTETPLHVAVRYGHADQIPKEFLAPEFLRMRASGYQTTLLHDLAYIDRLDLVPDINANSEMWDLPDYVGRTPRDVIEQKRASEAYVSQKRNEPATEKQKAKLGWFGCAWGVGITKGQASDAIDECVRRCPERDREYYNRPATEEQFELLRAYLRTGGEKPEDYAEEGKSLTYGQAKDLIWECNLEERSRAEEEVSAEIEKLSEKLRREEASD